MYRTEILTRKVPLDFSYIGSNTKANLEKWVQQELEGKCGIEGYIRPNSTNVLTYSSGRIDGNKVLFEVGFECQVCSPVEGHMITCKITNISKAGIRAVSTLTPNPVDVFCARDHHMFNKYFQELKEGNIITVKVMGQRYELNDPLISVIGIVMDPNKIKKTVKNTIKQTTEQ